jgi:hypothetical protein
LSADWPARAKRRKKRILTIRRQAWHPGMSAGAPSRCHHGWSHAARHKRRAALAPGHSRKLLRVVHHLLARLAWLALLLLGMRATGLLLPWTAASHRPRRAAAAVLHRRCRGGVARQRAGVVGIEPIRGRVHSRRQVEVVGVGRPSGRAGGARKKGDGVELHQRPRVPESLAR